MSQPKKPPVNPELGKQWLKRAEENGETPPQIAKKDGYDVRTIRKQIEKARQDRERREARFAVLRNALEKHYDDLISTANKIEQEILASSISVVTKQDRLYKALRQHLPRSSLWRSLTAVENLDAEIQTTEKQIRKETTKMVAAQFGQRYSDRRENSRLNQEGITGAVMHRLKIPNGEYVPVIKHSPSKAGELEVVYGSYNCGIVTESQATDFNLFLSDLMDEANKVQTATEIKDKLLQRRQVIQKIEEELETIKLRRIVPGRCKYCPI